MASRPERNKTLKLTENDYVYEPLPTSKTVGAPDAPGNSIRLLQFMSIGSGSLEVKLQQYELDEGTKFEALSYEWGHTGERETIKVDGKHLEIPRSLFLFLQSLNLTQTNSQTLYFADAICIDQQNFKERGLQVQLMGQVYSIAQCVHIWLGSERAGVGLLLKFCKVMKRDANENVIRQQFEQTFGEHNEAAFQEAVQAFSTCNYWKRLWVIQEVLLARELLVHCGKYSVAWHPLYEGCHRILLGEVWKSQSEPGSSFGGADAIAEAVPNDFDHSRYVSLYLQTTGSAGGLTAAPRSHSVATRSKRLYTLKTAVMLHGLAECTDRHDRIYGLLGLVLRGNGQGYFLADYNESLASLFVRVMYQCNPELRTDSIAFCRHLRLVLGVPFDSCRESIGTSDDTDRSTIFTVPSSVKYSIVVRFAGRLKHMNLRSSDENLGEASISGPQSTPLSTWTAGHGEYCWSTLASAKEGDLVYSIDDSCCAAIFRTSSSQSPSRGKRKRTSTLAVFVGRAIAHIPREGDEGLQGGIHSFLQADHHFASKLVEERPLLERPGAPWESQVPLWELCLLTCDMQGTRILRHGKVGSEISPDTSDLSQKGQGTRRSRRFAFQWSAEAANSQ